MDNTHRSHAIRSPARLQVLVFALFGAAVLATLVCDSLLYYGINLNGQPIHEQGYELPPNCATADTLHSSQTKLVDSPGARGPCGVEQLATRSSDLPS